MKNMSDEEPIQEEQQKLKIISSSMRQIIHKKLAQAVTVPECPFFSLYEALQLLRAEVGNRCLIEHFGKEEYLKISSRLSVLGNKIGEIKSYYDGLQKGTIESEDVNSRRFRQYKTNMAEVLIDTTLFRVFCVLLDNSGIKNLSIPNEYFKQARKKFDRPFNFEEDKQ
jgi:hypothetical protein